MDWGAFRELRDTAHALFTEDDPAELVEAMILIRNEKMRPADERLFAERELRDA